MIDKIAEVFRKIPQAGNILKAVSGLIVLYVVYKILVRYARKIVKVRTSERTWGVIYRVIHYCFVILAVMYVFRLFGINLNAVLGAAGIAGVAVGFAAQTSFSNIISGFFLLSEKTAGPGDFIEVDGVMGTVDSVNLLSVKLKTSDGKMVRVPNETIIKSNLINYSAFPLRRYSLGVQVSYSADLKAALDALMEVPARCGEVILQDPAPTVYVDSFGDSGINLVLNAWFRKDDLFAAKSALFVATKSLFGERGIDIPFPHVDLHIIKEA
ncbi:MAG: mechanosensitive ion channel family protein [Spirochaetaceae bacterium]|jgi:small-conductance mechanosensitive channel|nr:mechanosensitive ion channel family protein [Spirochaetaceae bacterium]